MLKKLSQLLHDILHPTYRISGPNFFRYLYREGDYQVHILFDCKSDGRTCLHGSSIVRWGVPHEDELIPHEKREEIIERLMKRIPNERPYVDYDPKVEEQEKRAAVKARELKMQAAAQQSA